MKEARTTIAWWGRLEFRVAAALVLLGALCVGASAYLVDLAVHYFDQRVGDALEQAREVGDGVEPFHEATIEASIEAYEARAKLLGMELGIDLSSAPDDEALRAALQDTLTREGDVLELVVVRPQGVRVEAARPEAAGADALLRYEVRTPLGGADRAPASGTLEVAFRIDPSIDERYQRLGEQLRAIGLEQESRDDVGRAVTTVLGGASALVLLIAGLCGVVVARTLTRKVTELSKVMAAVAGGDLSVRARPRGRDELAQLAEAFNRMLDELGAAQAKVAYLQRIGAWQGMARRIAHEIKNPLTPIQLAVQQIREKAPKDDPAFSRMLETSVEIVEDEIEGLRRMVAAFSRFAKVPQVVLAPTTLQRVLEEFSRAYGYLTDDDGRGLAVEAPAEEIAIVADRQLLKQALVNLVENATLSARESGADPVRVEVEARREGDSVEIRVDDNGPGIPAERRDDVFEPYETTRKSGTGLGLAIVKKVVLDHGGEVWIEDSSLGGACFVVRLPVAAAAPE